MTQSVDEKIEVEVGDITDLTVDAIVNAANRRMLGGGGVDGAIHRAAGPKLKQACEQIEEVEPGVRCPTGEARITPGFNLPADHVIHTVGPTYKDGRSGEPELLRSCYRESLRLADQHELASIAFPAISTGVYGYPIEEAAAVAVEAVRDWLSEHERPERVIFCCFSESDGAVFRKALGRD